MRFNAHRNVTIESKYYNNDIVFVVITILNDKYDVSKMIIIDELTFVPVLNKICNIIYITI